MQWQTPVGRPAGCGNQVIFEVAGGGGGATIIA